MNREDEEVEDEDEEEEEEGKEEEESPLAHVRENRKDSLDPLRTASKVRTLRIRTNSQAHNDERRIQAYGRGRKERGFERSRTLAPSHTRASDARPAKRAARLLFKAFPFIVSTMCSVTRGRNKQPPVRPFSSLNDLFILLFYSVAAPRALCWALPRDRQPTLFK